VLKNTELLSKLNAKQTKAILLLIEGKTPEEVSRVLGIHSKTLYRWLEKDIDFKKALQEAKISIFNEALENLKSLSREAVNTLRDLLTSRHKDTARLGSAKTILELALKQKELEDIEKRIEALEERLEGKNEP
jgi:DNA-directed RNA polymerase specialized sigma24 family protein